MSQESLIVLLSSALLLSGPYILAGMGGLASERSGVINIALEGKMLIACALSAMVGIQSQNPWTGMVAAIGGALLLSLLHYVLTQIYSIDHIVSGMAINAIALGSSNVLERQLSDPLAASNLPRFNEWLYVGLALVLPFGIWIYGRQSRFGLRVLAVGNDPQKARQMGVEPRWVRLGALMMTGVFCGLAGVMIISSSGNYVDQITAGRGFIALAALILGGWRPVPAMLACLAFGFLEALQLHLQGLQVAGAMIPPEFWKSLPYLATLLAMAGLLGRNRAPAGLGRD